MWTRIYQPAGKLRLQLKRSSGEFYRSLETLNGKSVRAGNTGILSPTFYTYTGKIRCYIFLNKPRHNSLGHEVSRLDRNEKHDDREPPFNLGELSIEINTSLSNQKRVNQRTIYLSIV